MVKIVEMPNEVDLGDGRKLVRFEPELPEGLKLWLEDTDHYIGKNYLGFSIRFNEVKYRLVEIDELRSLR